MKKRNKFCLFIALLAITLSCDEVEKPVDEDSAMHSFAINEVLMMRIYHELTLTTFHVMELTEMVAQFIKPELGLFCSNTLINIGPVGSNSIKVDFGHNCNSAAGLSKKGSIIFTFSNSKWTTGTLVTLNFVDFALAGRSISGSMSIRQDHHHPERDFRSIASFNNFSLNLPNGQKVEYNGSLNSVVFLSKSALYSHEITGMIYGKFTGNEQFESRIMGPLRFFQQCYEIGLTGFNQGRIESKLDERPIHILFGGSEFCVKDVTVKSGEVSRVIPI